MNPPIATAVRGGDYVFLSGIPPAENNAVVAKGDLTKQVDFVLEKMAAILAKEGLSLSNLVYVQVYLRSMVGMEELNQCYAEKMPKPYPARKVITTEFALDGVCVEISAIAYAGEKKTE